MTNLSKQESSPSIPIQQNFDKLDRIIPSNVVPPKKQGHSDPINLVAYGERHGNLRKHFLAATIVKPKLRAGASDEAILSALLEPNNVCCIPPYTKAELATEVLEWTKALEKQKQASTDSNQHSLDKASSDRSSSDKDDKDAHQASFVSADLLAETIYDPDSTSAFGPMQFAVYQRSTGKVTFKPSLVSARKSSKVIKPPIDPNGMVANGIVSLPSGVAPYISQSELVSEIKSFIHRYADVEDFWEELMAHYVLMTWVFDKFTAVPYLRLLGELQTGKTRILQATQSLCRKSLIVGGATTTSPMFRLIDRWQGTMSIDEADYKDSESWSDITKILNNGYMFGLNVLRSEGKNFEPRAFVVFGPKIISNRKRFEDSALESRCITLETRERTVRDDVKYNLPYAFYREAQFLRNKLLQWRFDRYDSIEADESKLRHLEPRLAQVGTAIFAVAEDSGFKKRFVEFLGAHGKKEKSQRPQAFVLEAMERLFQVAQNDVGPSRNNKFLIKTIADTANEVANDCGMGRNLLNAKQVGGLVRSLGFDDSVRTNAGVKVSVSRTQLTALLEKYGLWRLGDTK